MSGDAQRMDAATGRLRSLARRPLALLLLYGVMAGAAFSISKLAMGAGVRPISYTFWQVAGIALTKARTMAPDVADHGVPPNSGGPRFPKKTSRPAAAPAR